MKKFRLHIILITVLVLCTLLSGCNDTDITNNTLTLTILTDGTYHSTIEVKIDTPICNIEKPQIEGKVFLHWEVDGVVVNEDTFVIKVPCTLNAIYRERGLIVTFIDRDDTFTENVQYGQTVKEIIPETRRWCIFEGWFIGNKKYDFSQPVTTDITLVAVWTEDLEAAKIDLKKMLSGLYIPAAYYGDYAQQAESVVNKGLQAINSATSVDNANKAYDNAKSSLAAIKSYFDVIEETIDSYNIKDYFADEWLEIENIFRDVYDYIISYKGGVPTVEDYLLSAIEAADGVITKKEDARNADSQKPVKIRQLENYAENALLGIENEAIIEQVNKLVAEGSQKINKAYGTAELAKAFSEYIAKIDELTKRQQA